MLDSESRSVPDLRFGHAPLPDPFPGYDPAGDARALAAAGGRIYATSPIPGREFRGSTPAGGRAFLRVPDAWNGRLVVCGTPATRSEHANDAIFGDYLLARGYAYACSNKGIPFNARVIAAADAGPRAYVIPFPFGDTVPGTAAMTFGALEPKPVPVAAWHDDYVRLVRAAADTLALATGRRPERTYALGLSIGGGQVRSLLENHAELVDGGVEWAAVFWSDRHTFVRYLPAFLRAMPAYVESAFRDRAAHDEIVRAGFPPDRLQDGPFPSLWNAHYAAVPPFYNDLTMFLFPAILDLAAAPLAELAARAAYEPTPDAERSIASVAHTGRIGKPLIGIAGDADVFITPQHNFDPYRDAVRGADRSERYGQFEIAGGTHVDGYASLGWHLQPQLPFVLRAFEALVAHVEHGAALPAAGEKRRVTTADEIAPGS
jgi:hypothetical protein